MIPLTFLYDEYIGRPKLSEQKNPNWVYSSIEYIEYIVQYKFWFATGLGFTDFPS